MSPEPPSTQQTPSRYTYDPADPTPSIGGSIIEGGGQKNNIVIERRADVLTFTSVPILEKLCVIGQVSVNLFFKSTNRHTDIFARLCDVSPNGKKSINISDGIIRLPSETILVDPEGVCQVTINLQHTAHCFLPGHRIRLQISSGAYPLYARNLGTDESFASGTRMVTAQQEVFHDVSMSSSINLPVFNLTM